MATSTYHCPACGAPIEFHPDLQVYKCDYCFSQYTPEQMNEYLASQLARDDAKANIEQQRQAQRQNKEADQVVLNEYHCNNCGAHVVTDDTTTSTFCYYCHSPVIITARLQGDFRPDQIIPFKISEEKAKAAFLDWTKTKKYLPPDFTSAAHLEKMTGMYIPYWFMDADFAVDFAGTSTGTRSWRQGDYRYTEATDYSHIRQGTQHLTNINISAFSKIDQNLLNGVEPFDTDALEPFSMPYLSGFFAEQFTMPEADAQTTLGRDAGQLSRDLLQQSLRAAGPIRVQNEMYQPTFQDTLYTLLPVWVLTYQYEGKTYVYAMNGQTGKTFGELPIFKKKLTRDAWIRGVIFGAIIAAVVFIAHMLLR